MLGKTISSQFRCYLRLSMKFKLSLLLFFLTTVLFSSCKKGCSVCTGMSAPREFCEGDYIQKAHYQDAIDAYEATGGVCEEN